MKSSPKLLALTNKFLEEFFEMAHQEENIDEEETTKSKRNDSYSFHYTLADALTQSDHYVNDPNNDDSFGAVLTMSSISACLMQNELNFKSKDLLTKIQTLVDKHSESTCDRSIITKFSDKILRKEYSNFDWDHIDGEMTNFRTEKADKDYRLVRMNLRNTTNQMDLNIDVEYSPEGSIYEVKVFSQGALILRKGLSDETKIEDITFIRDINGLFSAMNNVLYSIENPED